MRELGPMSVRNIPTDERKRFKARAIIEGKSEQALIRELYRDKALGTLGVLKEAINEFATVATDQELILIANHCQQIIDKRKKASE